MKQRLDQELALLPKVWPNIFCCLTTWIRRYSKKLRKSVGSVAKAIKLEIESVYPGKNAVQIFDAKMLAVFDKVTLSLKISRDTSKIFPNLGITQFGHQVPML